MTANVNSTALAFSAQTFAKLSPHPFMLVNLSPPDTSLPSQRTNGRQPSKPRPIQVNSSSLTHTNGSAMARLGGTTVVCGIRAETLLVSEIPNYRQETSFGLNLEEIRSYDLLVPNLELATGSAPEFLPGVPPTTLAQTLSTRLYSLLLGSKMVQVDDLQIWETNEKAGNEDIKMKDDDSASDEDGNPVQILRAYWVLFIDITFSSYDGNPFDAAWISVLAALHNTKLPKAWWDADREMVVCSSNPSDSRRLNLHGFPVTLSASIFTERHHSEKDSGKFWVLVDPDRQEEKLCEESLFMAVDCSNGKTKILSISKHGGCIVDANQLCAFRKLAEQRWDELRNSSAFS